MQLLRLSKSKLKYSRYTERTHLLPLTGEEVNGANISLKPKFFQSGRFTVKPQNKDQNVATSCSGAEVGSTEIARRTGPIPR